MIRNSNTSNRVFNPWLTLACMAAMLIITAISFQLMYGIFQFIDMLILDISRHTNQYFTQSLNSNQSIIK